MRRSRLGAFGAICAVVLVTGATGVAPAATPPSATASQALVAGSPSAISCSGFVDARVTLTSQAGTTGSGTAVMLTLDLSGSMAGSKLADLKAAAKDTLAALDAADGATDQSIAGNTAGIVIYQGSSATLTAGLGTSYTALVDDIDALPAANGGSPHDLGINVASSALATGAGGFAKAIVLMTDGQAAGAELTNATTAADTAKASGARIVSVGIGADASPGNLQGWASQPSYYQSGTPGPIDRSKMISDLGAAVAVPTNFTVTETLGANFSAAPQSSSTGSVTTGPGTLQWTGSLTGTQSATLVYRATRNGSQVFATANELVSTMSLAVSGGTATVTPPASISIDVLPCGATPIASTTCTGAACSVSGTQGGVQYTANAGAPPAGTTLTLSSLNAPAPPAGVCAGFTALTQGAEFDVRPSVHGLDAPHGDPQGLLGIEEMVRDERLPRYEPEVHHRHQVAVRSQPAGDVRARRNGSRPLVGAAAQHPALRVLPGPRIRARAVHHESLRRLGGQRQHHVQGAVRPELDRPDDRWQAGLRPEALGRLSRDRTRRGRPLSGPPSAAIRLTPSRSARRRCRAARRAHRDGRTPRWRRSRSG